MIDKIEFEAQKNTEKKVNLINSNIAKVQAELKQLTGQVNEQNIGLIKNETLKKRKQLDRKIAELKGELREVKRNGRERIEEIGFYLQLLIYHLCSKHLNFIWAWNI